MTQIGAAVKEIHSFDSESLTQKKVVDTAVQSIFIKMEHLQAEFRKCRERGIQIENEYECQDSEADTNATLGLDTTMALEEI